MHCHAAPSRGLGERLSFCLLDRCSSELGSLRSLAERGPDSRSGVSSMGVGVGGCQWSVDALVAALDADRTRGADRAPIRRVDALVAALDADRS